MTCRYIASLSFLLSFTVVSAQSQGQLNRQSHRLEIRQSLSELIIDGVLDEETWHNADRTTQFVRVLPIDTGFADSQTEVMASYDDNHLYLAIICHDTVSGKRPAESLRRDFSFGKNDNFLVFMDTYNDQTNGFSFGTSASGAQWDGLQADGGFVNLNWDCKWRSAVHNDVNRWTAEYAIPFRSIKYKEGASEWGINFSRLDLKTGEKSSWAPVPRQFQTANLAFTGSLVWDKPPPKLATRFSVIPYVSTKGSQEVEAGERMKFTGDAGVDLKATIGTSLSLDVTINPDFSQVEVDQQVTNLNRFELFFPEKRQFFLDNSDLFASLGSSELRPFFSRRIGLESPVQAGFRLSGNLDQNWRLGVMNMQTGVRNQVPASNFSVLAVQRKVFGRSNITGFFINKNLTGDYDSDMIDYRYNRTAG
ncbi:MAG: carbohydrate binding family 9 domain-containing protein, partial [Saprospiraceae bacterium]|nr:carbohydrate binding family 9 domain-containing protein [Saprospiraceae bacterium]